MTDCKCGCPEEYHKRAKSKGDRRQCLSGYCTCDHYAPDDFVEDDDETIAANKAAAWVRL